MICHLGLFSSVNVTATHWNSPTFIKISSLSKLVDGQFHIESEEENNLSFKTTKLETTTHEWNVMNEKSCYIINQNIFLHFHAQAFVGSTTEVS